MNNKGFTLIEVLVVFVILAIVSVIAIPMFRSYQNACIVVTLECDLEHAYKTAHLCYSDGVEEISDWETMKNHGMRLSKGVVMNVEKGTRNVLLISAYNVKNESMVYEVNFQGVIRRR